MDTSLYQSSLVSTGLFRAKPWEPHFENSGPIRGYLLVFPRTSVTITHTGREPVVTSPNVVMFYNYGQEYRREKVSEQGDICEWFNYSPRVIVEAMRHYDRSVEERVDQPFRFTHGPGDSKSYFLQRMVVEHLMRHPQPDRLFVEETLLQVLDRAIGNRFRDTSEKHQSYNPEHKEITRATQKLLATRFCEPLTLEQIASALGYSHFHLARIFRIQTGYTIHSYLDQIRLRTALEGVTTKHQDLSQLAFSLGYSSHSHFTHSFKRTFGCCPSELRLSRTTFFHPER